MTSTIRTTDQFSSIAVNDFLRQATQAQRAWYLTRGEPQCLRGQYITKDGPVEKLHPGLRGVRVGNAVNTPEDAVTQAAAVKASLLEGPLEALDERALGIDEEAADIAARFREVGGRLDTIIHIGSMIGDDMAGKLAETIEEIVDHIRAERGRVAGPAPLLETIDPIAAAAQGPRIPLIAEDMPILVKIADSDATLDEEIADDFAMLAHDHGVYGFMVLVSVSTYTPHAKGGGASVHGGMRRTAWRYASTFQVATERALEWAEGQIDEMWPARRKSVAN